MCAQDKAGLASHRQARSQKTLWPSGNAAIRFPCPLSSHGCRVFSQYSSTSMSPPPSLWRRSGGPAGAADVPTSPASVCCPSSPWTTGPGARGRARGGTPPFVARPCAGCRPAGQLSRTVPALALRARGAPPSPPPSLSLGVRRRRRGPTTGRCVTQEGRTLRRRPPPPPPPTRLCEACPTRRNVPRGPATVSTPAPSSSSSSTECVRVSFIHRRSGSCSPRRGHSSPGEGEGASRSGAAGWITRLPGRNEFARRE